MGVSAFQMIDYRFLEEKIDIDTSYCKNNKENYEHLINTGCLPTDGNSWENSIKFPFLVIDENAEISPLHKSVIPHCQYNKEIVFNKTKNKWEYVSNSSQNIQYR